MLTIYNALIFMSLNHGTQRVDKVRSTEMLQKGEATSANEVMVLQQTGRKTCKMKYGKEVERRLEKDQTALINSSREV